MTDNKNIIHFVTEKSTGPKEKRNLDFDDGEDDKPAKSKIASMKTKIHKV